MKKPPQLESGLVAKTLKVHIFWRGIEKIGVEGFLADEYFLLWVALVGMEEDLD